MQWIDVTLTISPSLPVWPGDPAPQIEPVSRVEMGAPFNLSQLCLGSHTGTHVDPPLHFLPGQQGVDGLSLDILIGPAYMADFPDTALIRRQDLVAANIPDGTARLLLRTRNSRAGTLRSFDPNYVALAADAAGYLIEHGIRLVGIDAPSIEAFTATAFPVHLALLRGRVIIVEGLDFSQVEAGMYEMICLPLKIEDGDGGPARLVVRKFHERPAS